VLFGLGVLLVYAVFALAGGLAALLSIGQATAALASTPDRG
jgi:hypothetical protein